MFLTVDPELLRCYIHVYSIHKQECKDVVLKGFILKTDMTVTLNKKMEKCMYFDSICRDEYSTLGVHMTIKTATTLPCEVS